MYGSTVRINDIRHLRWKEKRRVNVKDNRGEDRMDKDIRNEKIYSSKIRMLKIMYTKQKEKK